MEALDSDIAPGANIGKMYIDSVPGQAKIVVKTKDKKANRSEYLTSKTV
jgi:hypothetical protein